MFFTDELSKHDSGVFHDEELKVPMRGLIVVGEDAGGEMHRIAPPRCCMAHLSSL